MTSQTGPTSQLSSHLFQIPAVMYDTAATMYQHHSAAPVSASSPGLVPVEDVG